jgi:hypothetical protein
MFPASYESTPRKCPHRNSEPVQREQQTRLAHFFHEAGGESDLWLASEPYWIFPPITQEESKQLKLYVFSAKADESWISSSCWIVRSVCKKKETKQKSKVCDTFLALKKHQVPFPFQLLYYSSSGSTLCVTLASASFFSCAARTTLSMLCRSRAASKGVNSLSNVWTVPVVFGAHTYVYLWNFHPRRMEGRSATLPPFLHGWKFHKRKYRPWNFWWSLGRVSQARLRIRVWWSGLYGPVCQEHDSKINKVYTAGLKLHRMYYHHPRDITRSACKVSMLPAAPGFCFVDATGAASMLIWSVWRAPVKIHLYAQICNHTKKQHSICSDTKLV